MMATEALRRYADIHDAWAGIIALLAEADPDPEQLTALHAGLATLATGLDQVTAMSRIEAEQLAEAAREADRLAQAAMASAHERQIALTNEQASMQRSRVALNAYQPGAGDAAARYIDRHS